jgi:hypothetical protein
LLPFREEGGPTLEHHPQKLSLKSTSWAVTPLNVELQVAVRTAQEVNPYFPLTSFVYMNVRRKMVVRIEPKAQPFELYAGNLAQPAS